MSDDPTFGTLPRFSRDITVLSGRLWDRDRTTGFASHGVLQPFSGVLDVRFERGRVPMLDLSYLSLESIVAPDLVRSVRDRSEHTTLESTEIHQHATETASTEPPGALDDRPELTVRELLVARRDAEAGDADGEGRGDRIDSGLVDERTPIGSPDGDTPAGVDLLDGPSFTTVDHSDPGRPTDGPEAREPGSRRDTTEPARESPLNVHEGVDTGQGTPSDFALERTVVDRSARSDEGGDQLGDAPSRTDTEDSVRTGPGAIAPPRMVPDRPERARRSGTAREASGRPGSTTESPYDGHRGRSPYDGHRGRSPSAHGVDSDDQLSAVIDASTDPESTLVDRLYRTLQERDAIERRRRGER